MAEDDLLASENADDDPSIRAGEERPSEADVEQPDSERGDGAEPGIEGEEHLGLTPPD